MIWYGMVWYGMVWYFMVWALKMCFHIYLVKWWYLGTQKGESQKVRHGDLHSTKHNLGMHTKEKNIKISFLMKCQKGGRSI